MDLPFLLAAFLLNAADLSPVATEYECHEKPISLIGTPIITVDKPRERAAALYLAAIIRKITGERPVVQVGGGRLKVEGAFYIGPCEEGDAFRVVSKGGSVWFTGRSDFAVYDWCERVLGVRNYGQVEGGRLKVEGGRWEVEGGTMEVPAVDYADSPVFSHRESWPCARETVRWMKLGGTHKGGVSVHAPHRWYLDEALKKEHPNIFARQPDGSRGEMPLLCYGNPETLAYYKERIDQHIAGVRDSGGIVDTNRHVITVSPWDCRLECSCEDCQRLFDPKMGITGSGSPIVWGYFLKELAKWAAAKHPDYLISFLPYMNMCDVPKGLDLTAEGNCEAMVCSMPGLALFKESTVREHEEALIRDWARVTGRPVLNWHYSCWPREFTSAPYLFGRTIAEHYRRMVPYEVGSFICGGEGGAAETLSTYIWHKCLWNPNIDVDAVYDAFAKRMFGKAAAPMRELMRLQEEGWAREWGGVSCRMDNTMGVAYTADDVREMKRLLKEAFKTPNDNVRWWAKDFEKFFAEEAWYRAGMPALAEPKPDGTWELVHALSGGKPKRRTVVSAQANAEGLAVKVWCEEPMVKELPYAAYGDNSKQDTLEIFFDASGTGHGCSHRLMFDVRNRMSVSASAGEWTASGVRHTVKLEEGAWVVDVFIPYASLLGEVASASGSTWRWNVVRWHPGSRGEREWTRISTLGGKWNQDRDAFSNFDILY